MFYKGGVEMEKKNYINLSKIKGLRAEHGDTQEDLAAFLGLSLNGYQRKERGETDFKAVEIAMIALKYTVEVNNLYNQ